MFWLNSEDVRLVKAWEAAAEDKPKATSCMALAPQGTFWILTKVGDLNPAFHKHLPSDGLAERIADKMAADGLTHLSFNETADLLEKGWAQTVSHVDFGYLKPIEIRLVQNKYEGLEEEERIEAVPIKRELAHT
ncbi:MAG: hypothetical protein HRT94_05150 [Alphaproteobacteria bacterium]|nr:hypothetical protein [Alphaproteobacteria bacterium]